MTHKLRYYPDTFWARLGFPDYRPRFFVETYIEKLRLHTPHFYQARLMNVFSNCGEMLTYIREHQASKQHSAYIQTSLDEIEDSWDRDPVASEVLRSLLQLRTDIFSACRDNLRTSALNRLRALCRAVLGAQERYATALTSNLEDSIFSTFDPAQKRRSLVRIYTLTSFFVTHLLNKGHSPTYLFNRAQMLTRPNNYAGRTALDQFRWLVGNLGNRREVFEVTFGIHSGRPAALLGITDEPDFAFRDVPPIEVVGVNLEKLKRGSDAMLFATTRVSSSDQVTAALAAKEALNRLLDAVTAFEMMPTLDISPYCFVLYRAPNGTTHGVSTNVDLLLSFMSSEVGSYFSQSETSIRQSFKGLDDLAREQLGRSLRYLRLARHSVSLEQKLLNLWISLEALFERSESSILHGILEVVPRLYAVSGLRRRVRFIRDLLAENDVAANPLAVAAMGVERFSQASEAQVFRLLRNEPAAIELFDSLGEMEHLKFKLFEVFDDLRDNISISSRIEKSSNDVSRQLRRIYFLRNQIAHTGHHKGVRPQLATHLFDYIAICYKAIAEGVAAAKDGSKYSISELLLASRMGADVVTTATKSTRSTVTDLDQIVISPVV